MSGRVVRLINSLYGLKQASKQWYDRLLSELKIFDFEQCLTDPCVLPLVVDDVVCLIAMVHVDDILVAGSRTARDVLVETLNQRFSTKHLGELSWYMGSEFKRVE